MKIGHTIDANGFLTGDVLDGSGIVPNVTILCPDGFHKPKWNGSVWIEGLDDAAMLQVTKQRKLDSLQSSCNQALDTFTSAALGTVHTYLSGQTDMLLIEAEDRYMNSADYDGTTPVLWYTFENGDVNHTKAQIHQMYLDARNNVQTVKYKMKNLNSQVTAATTAAAVNAIVW